MTDIYRADDYVITDILKQHYPAIKQEFQRWSPWLFKIRYRTTTSGPDLEQQGHWSVLPLMHRDRALFYTRFLFPTAHGLIKQIPIYENLIFSVYRPGTEIKPHQGWGDHFVRVQLGIDCNEQSALVVNDTVIPQRNGEVIIFNDYQTHWGYNRGNSTRVVMLFDILKTDLERSYKY